MADDHYAEIKEKFSGSWKLDRSEHFEDFLREVGVNIVVRKMASLAKPSSDVSVEDGKITISMNAGFMKKHDTFKLGETFDTDFQGQKSKSIASYADGVLTIESQPVDPNIKPTKATREITAEGDLLISMYIGDVVCKRWMKRIPA